MGIAKAPQNPIHYDVAHLVNWWKRPCFCFYVSWSYEVMLMICLSQNVDCNINVEIRFFFLTELKLHRNGYYLHKQLTIRTVMVKIIKTAKTHKIKDDNTEQPSQSMPKWNMKRYIHCFFSNLQKKPKTQSCFNMYHTDNRKRGRADALWLISCQNE